MRQMFKGVALGCRVLGALSAVLIAAPALAADLQISQYDWLPDPVPNGADTQFSIRATNNGPAAVNNAVVTIAVSDRFEVIDAPGNFPSYCVLAGTVGSQTLTCSLPNLITGIGNSQTFSYTALAIATGTANTQATIAASGNSDSNPANDSLIVTPTVRTGADLSLTKSGSAASVPAGGALSYTLIARNDGPNATGAVRVIDNLPAASDYTVQSATGTNWSCPISGTTVTCTYQGAAVNNGNYPPITITGKVVKATTGTVTNTASVESSDSLILDPNGANDSPPSVITTILAGTDLQASKTMPGTIIVGSSATITLGIRNDGPQNAPAGTVITDVIDASLTIGALPANCTLTGQSVSCTAGALTVGQSVSYAIPVTGASVTAGTLTNTASIAPPAGFTDADTSAGSNTATAAFAVVPPNADLSITKTKAPTPIAPGSPITSTITVRNQGPSVASYTPANPIRVTDTVTANESYVSNSPGWTCSQTGLVISCATTGTGTLAVGSGLGFVITTQAASGTDLTINNTACTDTTAGSSHTPSVSTSPSGNDCASAGVRATTETADLRIVKDVSLSAAGAWSQTPALSVPTGSSFYIRLQVSNLSGQTARTVNVTDNLPNFINDGSTVTGFAVDSVSSGSASYTASNGRISWTLANLAVGSTETLIVRIDRPVESGSFTNSASVSSPDTTEISSTDNVSTASYTIAPEADMTVNGKSVTPDPARVGVVARYTVSVRNVGANPADNVSLVDAIDTSRFTIIGTPTTTKPGGNCSVTAGTVTCSLGTFSRNETRQVEIQVMPLYPFGGTTLGGFPVNYTNRATVTTSTLDTDGGANPNAGNNFFDLTHSVDAPLYDLAVSKVEPDATFDPVRVDEQLVYDIRVSNFGPSRATGISLLDLPQPPSGDFTMTYDSVTINPVAANSGLALQGAPNAACAPSGGNVVCQIDAGNAANNVLEAGSQVIFRVRFTIGGTLPDTPQTFTNEARVSSAEQTPYNSATGADSLPLNNRAVQTTTVLPSTDLEVVSKTRVTGSPVNINQPVEYTIRVSNNGPSGTGQLRVIDTLPSGFALVTSPSPAAAPSAVVVGGSAATLSGAPSCTGTTTVTCVLNGNFPAGAANQVDLTLWVRAVHPYIGPLTPTSVSNTAAIEPGRDGNGDPLSEDPVPGNNSKTATVQVQQASIVGTVYADNNRSDTIDAGEGITGVTLTLTGTDANGNAISRTATTTTGGAFLFDRLPPSDATGYTVTQTQPGGYFDRNETAGSAGGTVANASYGAAAAQNRITNIVLPSNTQAAGYLFQEVQQASLSGYIYRDLDNDGSRDAGETGYAPADFASTPQLRLTGADYAGNAVNITTTVNASGFYQFSGLAPSGTSAGDHYVVTELVQPNGASDGLDSNGTGAVIAGSAGRTAPESLTAIQVNPGASLTERNFGELPTSSLSGIVYFDPNGNARQDSGEIAGLAGSAVRLQGTNDLGQTLDCTITTTASGVFSFPKTSDADPLCLTLRPGTYSLSQTPPPGLTHTGVFIGSAGGTAGSVTGTNTPAPGAANTQVSGIVIGAGINAVDYDFGESGQGIAGAVYVDRNANGTRDSDEQGIPGVSVTLSGTTATGQNLCSVITCTTTTDAAGNFSYTSVPGSNGAGYTLTEQAQSAAPLSAYGDRADTLGGLSGAARGSAGNDVFSGIVLNAGELLTNYLFGETAASLAGRVYIDGDDNGIAGSGEPGIGGVLITLSGTVTATGQDICAYLAALSPARTCTTTTASDGSYSFIDLPAGSYTLTQSQPTAYGDGRETAGTSGGTVNNTGFGSTAATNRISAIPLAAGASSSGNLFGERAVSLTGRVYRDPQRDGVDSGGSEPGIGGVTINLVQNGVVIATTITGADGGFSFINLPAGTYSIEEVQPAGYGSSTPNSVVVTVTAGGSQSVAFGETVSTIAGHVFVDSSDDGVRQAPGERGIAGVTIRLTGTDAANAPVDRTTTTDADGSYRFDLVLGGTYTLTQTQPATFVDGKDSAGSAGGTLGNDTVSAIALTVGTDAVGYDFGERGQGITGIVYDDRNRNGRRDGSDTPIAGVVVQLQRPDGSIVATTTTGADGRYLFVDIEAGDYVIVELQPAGYGDGTENGNNRRPITIVAGTPNPDVNFGEVTGSLAGVVYNDSDSDGARDANEPFIPGVTVTLAGTTARGENICNYLASLTPAGSCTQVTGADGGYRFVGLPGGNYTLSETQPAGYGDGAESLGTSGGTVGADQFASIALAPGVNAAGYLFGERGTAGQISGSVWLDANHDRVKDGNEPVRAGWTVQLRLGDTIVATTTTGSDGTYQFSGVAAGSGYGLRFISPEGTVYGGARTNEANSPANPGNAQIVGGEIRNLTLAPGGSVPQQSLPLDPNGVVYDSVRRTPVAGATVTISGPAGFDPAIHLLGGTASQRTGADGFYQFTVLPGAPNGTYRLAVTPPDGTYNPVQPSTIVPPCASPLSVGATPDPLLVSLSDSAPAQGLAQTCTPGTASTVHFLAFTLTPGVSAPVVNNHVPLDPVLKGAITVTKTTPKVNVSRGDLVPYTITATSTLAGTITGIAITDQMPAGFQYREGSARLNGVASEPARTGRQLSWRDLSFTAREAKRIDLLLVVGTGVREGEHVNQAWAVNSFVDTVVSDVAEASVRLVADPDFDCTDILGKVFDDRNANGVQDEGEPGLPGVRLATARGLLVTTDQYGRYHITCPMVANEDRGSNFILKLDPHSLPTGFRLTTANPDTVRLTRGKFVKLNFGAAIHRVVRVDVTGSAFQGNAVADGYRQNVRQLAATLAAGPSVLRIAYASGGENANIVQARIDALIAAIRDCWKEDPNRYRLIIEREVTRLSSRPSGDAK